MKRKTLLIFASLVLCFAACSPNGQATVNGLNVWIDAPRDQMTLPSEPYTLVFHANDPGGITQFEVSVNGAVLANVPSSDTESMLVNQSEVWTPEGEGEYKISVRAQNSEGEWSEPDQVIVRIDDSTPTPTHTPTTIISFTPTSTFTVTPTLTPTLTPTPKMPVVEFSGARSNISTVYTGGSGCGRKTVDFYVTVASGAKVQAVNVLVRLGNAGKTQFSEWKTIPMYVYSGNTWLASVTPDQNFLTGDSNNVNDYRKYLNGILEYTFTATVSGADEAIASKASKTVLVQNCATAVYCPDFKTQTTCEEHAAEGCVWYPYGGTGVCRVP